MTLVSHQIRLAARPVGSPTREDFAHEDHPVRAPGEGEAVLRTLYLSLDPYMRGRMSGARSYATPLDLGDVMVGATVSEVVESRAAELRPGQLVLGYGGWQTYSTERVAALRVLDPDAAPVTTALGVLGMPGFTAYCGLEAIGRPQPGETLVVAAATGPVGSAVGQLGKLEGCRVIGVAGGPDKVRHLLELGFDVALDHREPDLSARLGAAAPNGIDVYFENVGGAVWDAVLPHLNLYARVPVCGLAATYNETEPPAGPDRSQALLREVLNRSLTLRGFIQSEFAPTMYDDFLREMGGWVREGKVRYREDVTTGLDHAPEAFVGMLHGRNFGKTIVQVAA